MSERREVERRKSDRRVGSYSTTITKKNLSFTQSCPCPSCQRARSRGGICREHGIKGCMECRGVLRRTVLEALWAARYHFRGAYHAFMRSRSPVKKFAATCECRWCMKWRGRFMAEVEGGWIDESEED